MPLEAIKIWRENIKDQVGPERWRGQWIWLPMEVHGKNLYRMFRKTFSLRTNPLEATIYITADSSFRLWINGQYVHRGPARCAPENQSYDIINITNLLRKGRNAIAVLCHHEGIPTALHNQGRPGFLSQTEIRFRSQSMTLKSDSHWKVREANAWRQNTYPEKTSRGGAGGNLAIGTPLPPDPFGRGFTEHVDLGLMEPDWTQPGYDDTRWAFAAVVPHPYGWPERNDEPGATTRPWISLQPRDMPYLRETPKRASRVHSANDIIEYEKLFAGGDLALVVAQDISAPLSECKVSNTIAWEKGRCPLVLQNSPQNDANVLSKGVRSTRVVLDLDVGMNGYAQIEIEGPKGTIVDLTYAPHLIGNQIAVGMQAARNHDRLILSGHRDVWSATHWRHFRYMGITIRGSDLPVRIYWAGMTQIEYPFEPKGRFKTERPALDALWNAGAETVRLVTTDAYQDNYREQLQYFQTGYYSTRANWAAFGDPYLQRRLLIHGPLSQNSAGMLQPVFPGVIPGKTVSSIIEANLFYVMQFHDYLLRSGDFDTARKLVPSVQRIMDHFETFENAGGAIEDLPYEFWIDHAPLDRRGVNLCFNAFCIMALEDMAQAYEWLGVGEPARLRVRAARTRKFLRQRLWSSSDGLFVDSSYRGRRSKSISEHSNAIALLTGIANAEQIPSIVRTFSPIASKRIVPVSPLFMYYVLEGLFQVGHGTKALQILEHRFAHMLQSDYSTLWEDWSLTATKRTGNWKPASRCVGQAESAFPPDSLSRWLLGIWPTAPGMSRVVIKYSECGINKRSGTVPSPHGGIGIEWEDRRGVRRMRLQLPEGVSADVNLMSLRPKSRACRAYRLNEIRKQIGNGWVALDSGNHVLSMPISP